MKRVFAVTAALALLCLGSLAQANITIATVPVGDAGNAPDTAVMKDGTTGYGSVAYNYNIGKYDVTAGQYTAFLNAVAATDTYGLYNTTWHSRSSLLRLRHLAKRLFRELHLLGYRCQPSGGRCDLLGFLPVRQLAR